MTEEYSPILITNKEINHPGKNALIKALLERISSKTVIYSMSIDGDKITINPGAKSINGTVSITNAINEILNEKCEVMNNKGETCEDNFNCCNCGNGSCGCRYCFSCNACDQCL